MYFWCGGRKLADRALSRASSKVINFVGVEIARDLGLGFFLEATKNPIKLISYLFRVISSLIDLKMTKLDENLKKYIWNEDHYK